MVSGTACTSEQSVETTAAERAAASVLGLRAPVDVVHAGVYIDGGTIGFILQDVRSKPLEGCFDGRLEMPSPRHLYIGATTPHMRYTRIVEFGSQEEQALLQLLQIWLERTERESLHLDRRAKLRLRASAVHGLLTRYKGAGS